MEVIIKADPGEVSNEAARIFLAQIKRKAEGPIPADVPASIL